MTNQEWLCSLEPEEFCNVMDRLQKFSMGFTQSSIVKRDWLKLEHKEACFDPGQLTAFWRNQEGKA